ncbi:hypothetical protein [Embleya scabrispora]|uniref:hypothetical protein n=1 Tax=Embleya scabrispora TaxID=159449 RepID=UPI00035FCA11|nr:hypothetical protein [Embleya scabrispora]MYS81340.1 hypothetical protein [Streptomyces sp. SID5474]
MPPGELVRPGPDAATTDVVFREKGGSRGQAVLVALASVVWVPFVFGGAGLVIILLMVGFGAGFAKALLVAGLFAAAASLIAGPVVAARELRHVRRVQFAPARTPARLRFVRAGRPGPWLPIADLAGIHLHESIVEPSKGHSPPAHRTLFVIMAIGGGHVMQADDPAPTDALRLKQDLHALLSAVGIPVELETSRRRWPEPPSERLPSGSAHVAAIVTNTSSGGPGSGNAGGTSGGM